MQAFADLARRRRRPRPSRGCRRGRRRPRPSRARRSAGTGDRQAHRVEFVHRLRSPPPLRAAGTTAVSGEPSPGGKCSFSTSVPSARVGRAWSRPGRTRSCRGGRGCRARGRAGRAMTTTMISRERRAHQRRDPRPSGCAALGRCGAARARGQKARSPSTASSAGSRVKAASEHHRDPDRQDRAEPVGRLQVGDEQDQHRRDHGRRPRRRSPARVSRSAAGSASAGGRPRCELLAVAVDEQQRVVGAGAEDQHQQQEGALGVDGDPAGLDQQVGDADRDQVGGADGEQRQQRQERRPVDEQQQDQDQAEGRDQQRLAGFARRPGRGRRRSRPGR